MTQNFNLNSHSLCRNEIYNFKDHHLKIQRCFSDSFCKNLTPLEKS